MEPINVLKARTDVSKNPNLTWGDKKVTDHFAKRNMGYAAIYPFKLYSREDWTQEEIEERLTDAKWLVTSCDFSLVESPAAVTAYSNALSIPFNLIHPRVIPWYFRTLHGLRTKGQESHRESWADYVELVFGYRESFMGGLIYDGETRELWLNERESENISRRWPRERVAALAYPGAIEFMNTLFQVNPGLEAIIATEDIEPIAKKIMHWMVDYDHPERAEERISFEAYGTANKLPCGHTLMDRILERMDKGGNLLYIWDNAPEGDNVISLKHSYGGDRVTGLRVIKPEHDLRSEKSKSDGLLDATDIVVYRNFLPLVNLFPGQTEIKRIRTGVGGAGWG